MNSSRNPVNHSSEAQPSDGTPNTIVVVDNNGYGFSETAKHHIFICKVYSIIFCQLVMTIGIICMAIYYNPFKECIRQTKNIYYIIISTICIVSGTIIILLNFKCARRKFPVNLILLFLITIGFSLGIAVILTHNYPLHILYALGLTALITFILTIFAFQTKIDFTFLSGLLFIALVIIICEIIFAIFLSDDMIRLTISAAAAIILSIYLIYDTQIVIDGNHKFINSLEEYIWSAIYYYSNLCLIIYIFNFILLKAYNVIHDFI